jgi:hypothetical protein
MGIGGITPAQKVKWPREFYCGAPLKTEGLPHQVNLFLIGDSWQAYAACRNGLVIGVVNQQHRNGEECGHH